MPRTPAALAMILLFLAPPLASAGWGSDVEVTMAPYREGDLLRVRTAWTWTPAQGEPSSGEQVDVMLLEGPSRATDRYGIERDAFALRLERHAEGQETYGERCHLLAGGNEPVRHDVLYGSRFGGEWTSPSYPTGPLGLDRAEVSMSVHPVSVFWGDCPVHSIGRTTFREGERVRADELFPSEDFGGREPPVSEPAREHDFHGRPALLLRFNADAERDGYTGYLEIVVADGLPGVVAVDDQSQEVGASWSSTYRRVLEGYTPGTGAPMPPARPDARLPERNEAATWIDFEPLGFDDSAFALAYPIAEAVGALLDDPRMSLRSYIEDNPETRLVYAWYDAKAQNSHTGVVARTPTESTDGGWSLTFASGADFRLFYTSRSRLVDDRQLPVGLPQETHSYANFDQGQYEGGTPWYVEPFESGIQVADSATLLALAQKEGLRTPVQQMWFGLFPEQGRSVPYMALWDVSQGSSGDEGTERGVNVNMGLETAALTNVYATTRTAEVEEFLPLTGGDVGDGGRGESVSALAALAGPGVGAGLGAGAAATGLALLFVLVKFLLVPLFTRLKRDALLDNPVRARLYERVRTDPGIHLSELVDFAGIGYGATRHHLGHLTKHKLLTELDVDGKVRFYASGEVPPAFARHAAVLRNESVRRVYDLLVAEPHLSLREAARRLDLSAPSVHRIKKKLESEGLLPAAGEAAVSAA